MLRRLVGVVLARFEQRGIEVKDIKKIKWNKDLVESVYADKKQPLIDKLVKLYVGPGFQIDLDGEEEVVKSIIGGTLKPHPGTLRGDFATSVAMNIIHMVEGGTN